MIRVGTSHFVSHYHAVSYYLTQGLARDYSAARDMVREDVHEGSIHMGAPDLKPGQRLETIDHGTRYAIVEG